MLVVNLNWDWRLIDRQDGRLSGAPALPPYSVTVVGPRVRELTEQIEI